MDYREVLKTDTVLDRKYRIDRVIGAGGFGITYQAFDLGLASPVAVKEYYPSQFGVRDSSLSVRPRSDSDRQLFDRLKASFLREARTLAQFDHPAIVRVLSVFESHGTAYMVMKYESGPSLKAWLQGLGRSPRQSELDRLLWPLLDALESMHRADFLHRDIAPDNIIVRSDGTPVLLDFGASRRVYTDMSGTLTGVVKQGYSPQEQYSSDVRVQGPWTDIYALGATLYLAVTGRVPTEATARMLEDGLNPAIDSAHGGYRPEFLAAIDAAMQLHPRNRPQTVGEWRDMLFFGADADFPSDVGEGYLSDGSGYASDRGASSTPRTGTRSQTSSRPSAPQRVASQSRQTSQPRPSSRPSERQPQTSPKPSARLQTPPADTSEPVSPSNPAGTEVLAQRARQFATTPRGAMALGVGALLLGGGMLLAFDGGRSSSVSTAGLSGSASIDAEREVRRLEAEHKRIAALDAERKAREDEARQARQAAEQERAAILDAARRAKEAADRKAKEVADRRAREEADKQAREAAERQRIATLDAARKAKEEVDRKAREEADKQAREAAERQRVAALEAARKAREEAAERLRVAALQTPGRSTATQPIAAAPIRQAPFAAGATETGLYAQSVAIASALVIAGGTGGGIRLWDTGANQIRPLGASHADAVAAVAVAADGQHFASGAWDGEIRIWETRNGALQHTIASPGPPVAALGYRTPQRLVAMHTNGSWSIIEPIRGQLLMRSTATADRKVTAADVALDGRTVIVALADGASPFAIEGWVPGNGGVTTVTSRLTGHLDWVYAVASSPDIRRVASASADGTVRLWDWVAAREVLRLSGHSSHVRALTFSRDGALVAGAADDGRMIVWNASTGAVAARIDGPGSVARALAFSADGRTLTTASEDGQIRQWTVAVQP